MILATLGKKQRMENRLSTNFDIGNTAKKQRKGKLSFIKFDIGSTVLYFPLKTEAL